MSHISEFFMGSLLESIRAARAAGGKPALLQLLEILKLRLRQSPIGIGEYFEYGIWHASITPDMRDEFIGWRQSGDLDRKLNDVECRVLAEDKLLNYMILCSKGFPIPTPIATYCTNGRQIGDEKALRTHDEVRSFLKDEVYPFYVKPISAGYGHGVLGVTAREDESFRLFDGRLIGLDEFMAPFSFSPYKGMLFQKPLTSHPDIAEVTGTEAVSCVRFICLVTSAGPVIHTAFWKITTGRNMLDNFSHGDYGNCLGAINIGNGTIVRVISRMGPGGQIERHPTTQKPLLGLALPDWDLAVDMVCSASRQFPGLRLQNWDVALCPEGPVLLELNTESELAIPQAISGHGLKDLRLREILADIEQTRAAYRAAVAQRNLN
ncbi:MAG: hypothetical protein IPN64_13465 [Propionivibrio sp.]|uniref:sugar-transfer associated ATP-grasp domain-containing protein n=2 Tax=Propionivibrio sp. TaxID=2212460 RepID=UPI0025F629E5|nr:sugar-transfer associated ATP-grasp domain-containing protein [Propionivibrio sp.]MBK8894994.1 hypothetical protein [Propionivibrio sp.]